MGRKQVMDEERAALGRIVALLCALADLAELAGNRSPLVRGLVLWFLRHAETVARDFAAVAADMSPAEMVIVPAGNSPNDAVRLAMSFRALARQIRTQARLLLMVCRKDCGEPEPSFSGRVSAMRDALDALSKFAAFAGQAPHLAYAPDTS